MNQAINYIVQVFRQYFSTEKVIIQSPGRINFIGEHVDYNQGPVMPGAIDKYIWAALSRANSQSSIIAINSGRKINLDIKQIQPEEFSGWILYIIGVIKELQSLGVEIGNFNMVFGGNIPIGAGLASSAALENAVVMGLNNLFDLRLDKKAMILVSQRAEHNYVGVRCGIMDQFSSMFGQKNKLILLDTRNLEHECINFQPDNYELLLVNSNVKHNLATSQYNLRRQECDKAVEIIRKLYPQVNSLRDVSEQMLEATRELMPVEIYNRALFVVQEIKRVFRAKQAILNNNWTKAGELLYQSHKGLSNLYQVSCEELDFLVEKAMEHPGVAGSRMIGAGFGGCTLNLIEKIQTDNFTHYIKDIYQKQFNFSAEIYKVNLSEGTEEISI